VILFEKERRHLKCGKFGEFFSQKIICKNPRPSFFLFHQVAKFCTNLPEKKKKKKKKKPPIFLNIFLFKNNNIIILNFFILKKIKKLMKKKIKKN